MLQALVFVVLIVLLPAHARAEALARLGQSAVKSFFLSTSLASGPCPAISLTTS
jgi:hypothetical protein